MANTCQKHASDLTISMADGGKVLANDNDIWDWGASRVLISDQPNLHVRPKMSLQAKGFGQ